MDVEDTSGTTAQQLASARGFDSWLNSVIDYQRIPTPKPADGKHDPCALRRRLTAFQSFELSPAQKHVRAYLKWHLTLEQELLVMIDALDECEGVGPLLLQSGLLTVNALRPLDSQTLADDVGLLPEHASRLLALVRSS